jgi:hypothetical protein
MSEARVPFLREQAATYRELARDQRDENGERLLALARVCEAVADEMERMSAAG